MDTTTPAPFDPTAGAHVPLRDRVALAEATPPVAPLPPADAPPAPPAAVAPFSPEETAALRALLHELAPLVPYLPALRQVLVMLDNFDPASMPMPARMMMRSMGLDFG